VGRVGVLALVVAAAAVAVAAALAATQSPKQLREAMLAAAGSKHSLHYVSSGTSSGHTLRMVADVGRGRGIQRITFKSNGKSGPATVLVVRRTAYIRGNEFTMRSFFGFTPAQAAQYAGKWVSIPATSSAYSGVAADATFASFLSDLLPRRQLAVVRATVAGKKSVGLRGSVVQGGEKLVETVYAPAHGTPLPFASKAVAPGHPGTSVTRMSRWNEPVHLTAPAHAVPISTVLGG
jgi:hypothetical protein